MSEVPLPRANRCSSCGTELAATLLVCPACHALVHRERLATLAAQATAETDKTNAAASWREALALLPPDSKQHDAIAKKIDQLTAEPPTIANFFAKLFAPVTLYSVGISLAIYSFAMGWRVAAALIGAIYIHEMGHFVEARRRGITAGSPVFVPGFGAYVPIGKPGTPSADAQVGLAGPLWGFGASVAALAAYVATGMKFWGEVAEFSATLNLFNLTPVWQLDGSRGFHAMSRMQRWLVIVVLAATFAVTRQRTLLLVGAVALFRAFEKNVEKENDWTATAIYAGLVVAFAGLATFTP